MNEKNSLLEAEQADIAMGKGDTELVETLSGEISKLEIQLGWAEITTERLGLETPGIEQADFTGTMTALLHSPSEFGEEALQAAGGGEAAQLELRELELIWQTVEQAQQEYQNAAQKADEAENGYKTGKIEQQEWCDALCTASDALIQLYEAVYSYTEQILSFNLSTQGYLSELYGWEAVLIN